MLQAMLLVMGQEMPQAMAVTTLVEEFWALEVPAPLCLSAPRPEATATEVEATAETSRWEKLHLEPLVGTLARAVRPRT